MHVGAGISCFFFTDELENLLRQASVDIRANPALVTACPIAIKVCRKRQQQRQQQGGTDVVPVDANKDGGRIEECLKRQFLAKTLAKHGDGAKCIHEVAKIIETASRDLEVDVPLHEACGLDVSKFCRDTAAGGGERISCLRNIHQDPNMSLEPKCEALLVERLQLYRQAIEVLPVQSFQDFVQLVQVIAIIVRFKFR